MQTMWRYLNNNNVGADVDFDEVELESPLLDKKSMVRNYMNYMLDRTSEMFEYNGLPDTIPAMALERMLQTIGYVVIAKVPGRPRGYGPEFTNVGTDVSEPGSDHLFALYGSFGQAPDPYMAPVTVTVANAGFTPELSKEYTINKDCIIMRNDMAFLGLLPLFKRYAWELTEGDISLRSAMINLREQTVIVATSDSAYESALLYLKNKEDGKIGAIMDTPLLGETKVTDSVSKANGVIQIIEGIQYLKASWFNELGLNQAFNMKREYLSSEEIAANNDILLPLVDNMLNCRKLACEAVNRMFGTNITVKKNSAWDNKQIEKDLGIATLRSEVESNIGADVKGSDKDVKGD